MLAAVSVTTLPPKATILSYLSSAQQVLTDEPQESIRKPIIAIMTLNSKYQSLPRNLGNLTGKQPLKCYFSTS